MINMLSETDQTELTLAAPQNFMPFKSTLLTTDEGDGTEEIAK